MRTLDKIESGLICAMGGSGGGGSGIVDYPSYMKDFQGDILNHTGVDTITDSMVDVMNAMLGNSPFTGETAYDPDSDVTAMETAVSDFAVILAGLDDTVDWAAIYAQATSTSGITETEIVADVDAFADQLDDEITTKVLPRFRRGMQDINAVVSSAFPLGQAVIEGFRDRDVAKHNSAIRLEAAKVNSMAYLEASNQMIQIMSNRIHWESEYVKILAETRRIKIVAKKEEAEVNLNIDEADAMWDISVFQHSANMLASIGGGTVQSQKKQSTAASAIGGAMTGAAAGAMVAKSVAAVSGPVGIIGGALLGAASAFL